MTLVGGITLLSTGILGEYLARVYLEVKQRPLFLVAGGSSSPTEMTGPPDPCEAARGTCLACVLQVIPVGTELVGGSPSPWQASCAPRRALQRGSMSALLVVEHARGKRGNHSATSAAVCSRSVPAKSTAS